MHLGSHNLCSIKAIVYLDEKAFAKCTQSNDFVEVSHRFHFAYEISLMYLWYRCIRYSFAQAV